MNRAIKTLVFLGLLALTIWIAQSWLVSSGSPSQESLAPSPESTSPFAENAFPIKELKSELPLSTSTVTVATGEDTNTSVNTVLNEEVPVNNANPDSRRAHIKAELVVMGGLDEDVIIDFIDRQQPQLSSCYERMESAAPGRLIVRLLISPLGRVIELAVDRKSSTIQNKKMEECVFGILKRTVFPEPKGGGSVEVDYPFTFPLDRLDSRKNY